jgi:hypothetical protein
MRRLLREIKTKRWVTASGSLSSDIHEAVELNDVGHALRLCREHNLRGLEIVLKFEREELDVALSMGDAC